MSVPTMRRTLSDLVTRLAASARLRDPYGLKSAEADGALLAEPVEEWVINMRADRGRGTGSSGRGGNHEHCREPRRDHD